METLLIISTIGFLFSLYALIVEVKLEKNKDYKAVCDINDKFSCTKTFKSGYGKLLFGIPNPIIGLGFYTLVFVLVLLNYFNVAFYLSILAVIGSVYLWYVLHFKVKTICIVCYSIYIVNILLLVFSWNKIF